MTPGGPGLGRPPLRRHPLGGGSPRHYQVVCSVDCGWKGGTRTADNAEKVEDGRPCPICRAGVKVVGS